MHKESVESTAFIFPGLGTYVWKVLPFGIAGAPGAMEALMRHVLAKELEKPGIEVYLDDILVHANTKDEHDALLLAVLRRLEENDFHLKAAKCAIPCSEVNFLGYRIQGGLPPDALECARDPRLRLPADCKRMAAIPWDGNVFSGVTAHARVTAQTENFLLPLPKPTGKRRHLTKTSPWVVYASELTISKNPRLP